MIMPTDRVHSHPISHARPVVVGYTGSDSSRNALKYAAGMARRLRRPLLTVYITSPSMHWALTFQIVALPRAADSVECWLVTELNQAVDTSELTVYPHTRRGSPARELASIAAEFSADALVIGAPRPFWHHPFGSVVSRLAHNTHCPVIVVPYTGSMGAITSWQHDGGQDVASRPSRPVRSNNG